MGEPPPHVEPAPPRESFGPGAWWLAVLLVLVLGLGLALLGAFAGAALHSTGNLLDGTANWPLLIPAALLGALVGGAIALRIADAFGGRSQTLGTYLLGGLAFAVVEGMAIAISPSNSEPISMIVGLLPAAFAAVALRVAFAG